MSKTTPEEAKALAQKHGFAVFGHDYHQLAALIDELRSEKALEYVSLFGELQNAPEKIDEVRGVDAEPVAGGSLGLIETHPNYVAGFKAGHAAGRRRIEPAPSQPAAPVELPVVGDAELLDSIQKNMELSFDYGDEDGPGFWCVHRVHGSVNDREWTLIGKGRAIREAINAAIAAGRKAS